MEKENYSSETAVGKAHENRRDPAKVPLFKEFFKNISPK
jgi:hypothetical protein